MTPVKDALEIALALGQLVERRNAAIARAEKAEAELERLKAKPPEAPPYIPFQGRVVRIAPGETGSGSSSGWSWCSTCGGWHIPGAGPCTETYSSS